MTDRFARPPEEGPEAERVRIIGAEEAQEAIERGDVAPRLSEQDPRPGDRPVPPAEGPRPTLRFPLSDAEDPYEIARPAIVPPESLPQHDDPHGSTWDDGADHAEPVTTAASWDDPGFGAPAAGFGYSDEPAWADSGAGAGAGGWEEPGEQGPSSQPVELPHWTDPPTGEVPRVIASEEEDDLDAWSTFASSTPPRWRDENSDWSEGDYEVAALGDDETRVGALDSSRTPHPEDDPFAFDEPEPAMVGGAYADDAFAEEDHGRHERPARRPLRRAGGGGSGGGGGRDVQTATAVGAGLGLLALIFVGLVPPKIGIVVVTAVAAVAAWEFFGATHQGGARAAVPVGLVAAASMPLATYWRGLNAIPLVVALALITTLLWYVIGAGGNTPVLEGVGTTLLGAVWIGVLASYAAVFLQAHKGNRMLIAVILVTVAADVGGFFGGQSFGQRPLSKVSPNKTIEGAIAGLISAVAVGVIIVGGIWQPGNFHTIKAGFLLGLAAGIIAPIGDLCESVIKRDLGVKDMGSLLPGHGGILDRIDGLLFVLPAAFYLITTFKLTP
jgi:phosphatidate cytidylyltransferase